MVEGTLRGEAVSTTRPLAAIVQRFSITHGVNLALVNAVARLPFRRREPDPRWFFTGRLGAGASVPHPESTIAGTRLEQYEWGAFSVQAAAGVEVRLGRRISLAGEVQTHPDGSGRLGGAWLRADASDHASSRDRRRRASRRLPLGSFAFGFRRRLQRDRAVRALSRRGREARRAFGETRRHQRPPAWLRRRPGRTYRGQEGSGETRGAR